MNYNTNEKKVYVNPIILIEEIELEVGIAVGSYNIKTGETSNEPRMEDWDTNTDGKFKNFDL